eukprot:5414506-Alexandrium_andersonii.AAC.1
MAFVAVVLMTEPAAIVRENARSFPSELMELLGPKRIAQRIELDAKAQVWPVNRVRCYRIPTQVQ